MKKIIFALLLACSISSCKFVTIKDNSGFVQNSVKLEDGSPLISQTYDVTDFDAIDLQIPSRIVYSMSDTPLVRLSAPEDLYQYINVDVTDGVLSVSLDRNVVNISKKVQMTLSSSRLKSLNVRGSGDFKCERIHTDDFSVDVAGAGDVSVDNLVCANASVNIRGAGDIDLHGIACESLCVLIQGAGDMNLSGKVTTADFRIQGAGDIDASKLEIGHLKKSIGGAGRIKTK